VIDKTSTRQRQLLPWAVALLSLATVVFTGYLTIQAGIADDEQQTTGSLGLSGVLFILATGALVASVIWGLTAVSRKR
jgi:hypothetical protein